MKLLFFCLALIFVGLSMQVISICERALAKQRPFKVIDLPEEFYLKDTTDNFTCKIARDTLFIQFKK